MLFSILLSLVHHSEPKSIVGTLAYIGPKVMLKKEYDASYDPSYL